MNSAFVDFICPFCKGSVTATTEAVIEGESRPAVFHSLPPCKEFTSKDVTTFLHDARMRMSA